MATYFVEREWRTWRSKFKKPEHVGIIYDGHSMVLPDKNGNRIGIAEVNDRGELKVELDEGKDYLMDAGGFRNVPAESKINDKLITRGIIYSSNINVTIKERSGLPILHLVRAEAPPIK